MDIMPFICTHYSRTIYAWQHFFVAVSYFVLTFTLYTLKLLAHNAHTTILFIVCLFLFFGELTLLNPITTILNLLRSGYIPAFGIAFCILMASNCFRLCYNVK